MEKFCQYLWILYIYNLLSYLFDEQTVLWHNELHVCGIAGNVAVIIMHIMCNYGFILASWTVCAYLAYLLQLNTVVCMGKTDTTQAI
jgi:hypothetical protein